MKEKKYKILVFILIPIILIGGWYFYRTINEFNNFKQSYSEDKYLLTWRLRGDVLGLDNYLAKSLVSIDDNSRFDALLSSLSYSNVLAKSMHNVSIMSRRYNPIYSQSYLYLDYLVKKNQSLDAVEKKNIKLIRKHISIIDPAYEKIARLIREKELTNLQLDEEVVGIIDDMINDLERLPNIGEDDENFKKYNNRYGGYYPRNLFKEEKEYTTEELSVIAKKFMGKLWEGLEATQVGAGSNPEFGEYIRFSGTKDSKLVGSYEVNVSKYGGHIMRFEAMEDFVSPDDFKQEDDVTLGQMSTEEAIDYGKELMTRWGEEKLELYETLKKGNLLYLTFVPIRDGIPLVNRKVEIVINTMVGKPLNLDSHDYFINYNRIPKLEANLSKEEIINMVSNKIDIDGELSLAVVRGITSSDVLVYKIPVKDVENVEYIYLNAVTGKDEGLKYTNVY